MASWQPTETWEELRERSARALPTAEREFRANSTPMSLRWEAAADCYATCKALAEGREPPIQALNAIPDNFAAWLRARGF